MNSPSVDLKDLLDEDWLNPVPSLDHAVQADDPSTTATGTAGPSHDASKGGGRKRGLPSSKSEASGTQLDAQRKWRNKEKAMVKDLEAELQQKIAQANELSATNSALRRKQSMLEAVLLVREDQLRTLAKEGPALAAHSTRPETSLQVLPPAQAGEAPKERVAVEEQVIHPATLTAPGACAGTSASLQVLQEQQEELPAPPALDQPLPSLKLIPPHTTWNDAWIQRLRRTTPKEWQSLWLEFIKESSMLAISADAHGPGSLAHDCLSKVVSRYLGVVDYITLLNPSVYYESLYINLSTGKSEHPPASHWETVARAVAPTPAQLRDCATALASFDECMAKVLAERAALVAKLGQTPGGTPADALIAAHKPVPITPGTSLRGMLDQGRFGLEEFDTAEIQQLQQATFGVLGQPSMHGTGQPPVAGGAASQRAATAASAEVAAPHSLGAVTDLTQLTKLLSLNLAKEHAAHSLVSDFLCTRVLTVVQLARAAAVSWPWMPDVTAILKGGLAVWQDEIGKPG